METEVANRIPATLIFVSNRELLVAAFVAGALCAAAYQIGKASQRNWMTKNLKMVLTNKTK